MKIGVRGALGILLSVALLTFALRGVSPGLVMAELATADPFYFLLATIAGTLTFPLRALRWQVILSPVAERLPLGMLWRATAIGMMVNNVVPARAGEIARAYALTRETTRVSFSASFASLAVDRLFDAFVLLLLLLLAMLDPAFAGDQLVLGRPVARWTAIAAMLFGAVAAVMYAFVLFPGALVRLFETLSQRVAPRFEERGRTALLAFLSGLGVLRHPGRFALVLGWTVVHWLTNALAFWLGFIAVGIDVPYSAALLLQGLIGIAVAAPAAPGFFGVFEAVGRAGLALYAVDGARAVSWAIGYHILTFIPITIIGAVYFARLGLSFRDIGERAREGKRE